MRLEHMPDIPSAWLDKNLKSKGRAALAYLSRFFRDTKPATQQEGQKARIVLDYVKMLAQRFPRVTKVDSGPPLTEVLKLIKEIDDNPTSGEAPPREVVLEPVLPKRGRDRNAVHGGD
jgi:hypothetical protein